MKSKILSYKEDLKLIESILKKLKKNNKRIALAHGVYDLLHYGHVSHFQNAKQICDVLIVSITSDKYVMKGPGKPIFPQMIRSNMILSIEYVDYVIINNNVTPIDLIKKIKPNYYVKGPDYKNKNNDITKNIYLEEKAIKSVKGKLFITEDISFSSSSLINKHLNPYPKVLEKLINKVKEKYDYNDIENIINKISKLKILLIGESILDRYSYIQFLGHAGKLDIIPSKFIKSENFYGGVLASTRNLCELSKNVSVLSVVGKDFLKNNYLKLFKSHKPTFNLFKIQNINTLLKERYVNKISLNKTFEVYKNFPFNINQVIRKKLLKYLRKNINNFDLVIVSDYGHGLFNDEMMSLIEKKSKFLSVNAQTNAGNRGFNLITKYKKADYYCVDLPEARLALSDQDSSLVEIITKLSKKLRSKNLIISLGKDGCIIYNNKDKISQYPAFNVRPVDTMGAGDAFLCISSLLNYLKVENNLLGLLSNLYASIKVNIEGHSREISLNEFKKSIYYLLR